MRVAPALAVLLMTLTVLSCAQDAERALLTAFFSASRLRDLTALRQIATVVFEPTTDGIVTSFEILHMTAVQGPDGLPVSKGVSLSAPVRLPDGRIASKTLVVTMEHRPPAGDRDPWRNWVITAITAAPAPLSGPRP